MPLDLGKDKDTLDWLLGGAGPTRPAGRWISFATASPTSQSAFDGPFTPRCTVSFAAANSPQGSATNLNVVSATLTSSVGTAVGWNLWDSSSSGSRIAWGTLANLGSVRTAGSTVGFAAGSLKITMV